MPSAPPAAGVAFAMLVASEPELADAPLDVPMIGIPAAVARASEGSAVLAWATPVNEAIELLVDEPGKITAKRIATPRKIRAAIR